VRNSPYNDAASRASVPFFFLPPVFHFCIRSLFLTLFFRLTRFSCGQRLFPLRLDHLCFCGWSPFFLFVLFPTHLCQMPSSLPSTSLFLAIAVSLPFRFLPPPCNRDTLLGTSPFLDFFLTRFTCPFKAPPWRPSWPLPHRVSGQSLSSCVLLPSRGQK